MFFKMSTRLYTIMYRLIPSSKRLMHPRLNGSETSIKLYSSKQLKAEAKETIQASEIELKPQEQNTSSNNKVLDDSTIQLLERLSLVNFGSEKSKVILQDAIKFADKIHEVNVDNVQPLVNVLEQDFSTPHRDDVVDMGNTVEDVMLNAKHVEEDYFVAPPSNVPLYQNTDEK